MQFARPRIGRRRRARGNYNARTPVINYRDTRSLMDHRGGSAWRERSEGNRDVSARRAGQLRRYPRELIGTIKGRGKRGAQPRFRARPVVPKPRGINPQQRPRRIFLAARVAAEELSAATLSFHRRESITDVFRAPALLVAPFVLRRGERA